MSDFNSECPDCDALMERISEQDAEIKALRERISEQEAVIKALWGVAKMLAPYGYEPPQESGDMLTKGAGQ